jgi:hypothetical protein
MSIHKQRQRAESHDSQYVRLGGLEEDEHLYLADSEPHPRRHL